MNLSRSCETRANHTLYLIKAQHLAILERLHARIDQLLSIYIVNKPELLSKVDLVCQLQSRRIHVRSIDLAIHRLLQNAYCGWQKTALKSRIKERDGGTVDHSLQDITV